MSNDICISQKYINVYSCIEIYTVKNISSIILAHCSVFTQFTSLSSLSSPFTAERRPKSSFYPSASWQNDCHNLRFKKKTFILTIQYAYEINYTLNIWSSQYKCTIYKISKNNFYIIISHRDLTMPQKNFI